MWVEGQRGMRWRKNVEASGSGRSKWKCGSRRGGGGGGRGEKERGIMGQEENAM